MSINEAQRRRVFTDLERALGAESAAIVMERVFAPVEWSDIARQANVDAQFVAVRGEMAELRAELKGQMGELRAELKGELGGLRGEVAELRAEVHGTARRLAAINAVAVVAASMSTAGLVLAASHL